MRLSRRGLLTALLLALLAFVAHGPALQGLLPDALPSTGDTIGAFVPWHEFARQALWQRGEMPLWNPHLYCGMPFLANGQSALLYPPTYLHFLLPENVALWLFAWGHSCFYMIGGYFLGRVLGLERRSSFLIALLLGLGNATPAHLFGGHLTFLPTRSYWPWEIAFLLRLLRGGGSKNAIAWAASLALSLAAGAPQIWLFGVLFNLGVIFVWLAEEIRKGTLRPNFPLRAALVGTALLLLWCAPILLPLQELKSWSAHGSILSFAEVTNLSATPRSLFRLLLNGFFGGNSFIMWSLPSNPGEDAASIGLAATLLAVLSPLFSPRPRVVWPLYLFCGLLLALALGSATPLYRVLYEHIWFFQNMRVPARWLELWAFSASILAGFTLDGLLRQPGRARWFSPLWILSALCCFLLLGAVWLNSAPFLVGAKIVADATGAVPEKWPAIAANLQNKALLACLYSGATVALLAWFWRQGFALNRQVNAYIVLIIVLLAVDPLQNFWFSTRTALPATVVNAHIPPSLQSHYAVGQRWIMRAPFGELNAPLLAGIDALNGYEPFGSRPFFEFAAAAQGRTDFSADFQPRQMSPLWRVAGASHLLWKPRVPGEEPFTFPGQTIARSGQWRLNSLDDGLKPWPRSYLTTRVVRGDGEAAFTALKELARQPWLSAPAAVVPTDFPPLENAAAAASGSSTLEVSTPDARSWKIVAPHDALLVENETLAPGWKAYVDAKPTKMYRANGIFRGVFIPAGTQRAALVLDSQTLRFSLFLALCGLTLATFSLSAVPRKNRAKPRPAAEPSN